MSVKFLPSTKARKVLSDDELNNKLNARARNRKDSWPLETETRPVLIRAFTAPTQQPKPHHVALDQDDSPKKESVFQRAAPSKRLRDDSVVEAASLTTK